MSNKEILRQIQNGEANGFSVTFYYEQLYKQNIPLIQQLCNRFGGGVEQEDVLQECFFALYDAVQHYNGEKGQFTTLLFSYIKKTVLDYRRKSHFLANVPQHYSEKLPNYKRFILDFEEKNHRFPNDSEIMQALHLRHGTVQILRRLNEGCASLNVPLRQSENDLTVADTLESNEMPVEMQAIYEDEQSVFDVIESCLNENELKILKQVYEHGGNMAEVARLSGKTRERIRQIVKKSLQKINADKKTIERLQEEMEIMDANLYRGSFSYYVNNMFTSVVEKTAEKKLELERQKRHKTA